MSNRFLLCLGLALLVACADEDAAPDGGRPDAAIDQNVPDMPIDIPIDAGPFVDERPIRAEEFDCRAAGPPAIRDGVHLACWLDDSCDDSLVVAHRASGGLFGLYAPENSLSGIRLAILFGADAVELDVRTTSDGELVLMHDSSLERTTGEEVSVLDSSLAELTAIQLASEEFTGEFGCETVPTLRSAIELARGRVMLILDTKTDRGDLVAELLREEDMLDGAFVSVSDPTVAVSAREAVPEVRIQLRPDTVEEFENMRVLFERAPEILEVPLSEAAAFVPVASTIAAKVFVDIFHIDALVFSRGDLSEYQDAYASGATIAQSEFAPWVLEMLGRRDWSTLPPHRMLSITSPLLP